MIFPRDVLNCVVLHKPNVGFDVRVPRIVGYIHQTQFQDTLVPRRHLIKELMQRQLKVRGLDLDHLLAGHRHLQPVPSLLYDVSLRDLHVRHVLGLVPPKRLFRAVFKEFSELLQGSQRKLVD